MNEKNKIILNSMIFDGEGNPCNEFIAHPMKANHCINCAKLIEHHRKEIFKDQEQILLKAFEFSSKGRRTASVILERNELKENTGSLLHGGINSVIKIDPSITHVVTTAKGLGMFTPAFDRSVKNAMKRNVIFYNVDWLDNLSQSIKPDLQGLIEFIDTALVQEKGNVLVHCAQGKSRSSTVVIAYLLYKKFKPDFDAALTFVQSRRRMAEPNIYFQKQLKEWHRDNKHLF